MTGPLAPTTGAGAAGPGPGRRIFVCDCPRTCSVMFNKLFAGHPQLGHLFFPMIGPAMYGPERLALRLRHAPACEAAMQGLVRASPLRDDTYAAAFARIEESVAAIEKEGRIPFIKDHAHCVLQPALTAALVAPGGPPPPPAPALPANPTAWPDAFFESLTPVFLIRHPARMVPSCLRAGQHVFGIGPADEDFRAQTSLGLARVVFDAYDALYLRRQRRRRRRQEDDSSSSQGPENDDDDDDDNTTPRHPLVVDAEDVVHHTEALLPRLCAALGLDPAGVRYSWDPVPREQWGGDPIMRGFFGDVMSSSCVRRETQAPKEIHMEDKRVEWTAEFGEERAVEMVRRVEEEMPHYEYLRRFRLAV